MSSTQSFTLSVNYNNASTYLTKSGSNNLSVPYSYGSEKHAAGIEAPDSQRGETGYVTFNNAAKDILFPNSIVTPTSISGSYGAVLDKSNSSARLNFEIDNTTIATGSNLTASVKTISISNTTARPTKNSTMRFKIYTYGDYNLFAYNGCYLNSFNVTLNFTRYDFSANAGSNVTNASVSSSTGYDGDTITYSCVVGNGSTFEGWYDGSTLVSSSQTYTHTVNGADLSLTAKASAPAGKVFSATYNGVQLQGFPIEVDSDVNIYYNSSKIATVPYSGGNAALNCNNKVMKSNVILEVGGAL